jgi:hypothetical protein
MREFLEKHPPEPPKGQGKPQASAEGVESPAINVAGRVYRGRDHVAAYRNAKSSGTPDTSGAQEGFLTDRGRFVGREEAADLSGLPTEVEAGKLHSSDLA